MYAGSTTRKEAQAIAVLAYVDEGGAVLLIKRGTPPYLGYWSLPGGGTDEGEDPREACIREVKEETGFDVEIIEEVGRIRGSPIYSCKITAGEARANPPETLVVSWVPLHHAVRYQLPPEIKAFLEEQVK